MSQATANSSAHDGINGVIIWNPNDHFIVKPNLDTSYISGFFDLENYSYTLTVPNNDIRYWIVQHLDATVTPLPILLTELLRISLIPWFDWPKGQQV